MCICHGMLFYASACLYAWWILYVTWWWRWNITAYKLPAFSCLSGTILIGSLDMTSPTIVCFYIYGWPGNRQWTGKPPCWDNNTFFELACTSITYRHGRVHTHHAYHLAQTLPSPSCHHLTYLHPPDSPRHAPILYLPLFCAHISSTMYVYPSFCLMLYLGSCVLPEHTKQKRKGFDTYGIFRHEHY